MPCWRRPRRRVVLFIDGSSSARPPWLPRLAPAILRLLRSATARRKPAIARDCWPWARAAARSRPASGRGTGAALAYPLRAIGRRLPQRDGQLRVGWRIQPGMIRRELGYFLSAPSASSRGCRAWLGRPFGCRAEPVRRYCRPSACWSAVSGRWCTGLALHLWPQPVAVLLSMAATIYATGAFATKGRPVGYGRRPGGGADRCVPNLLNT